MGTKQQYERQDELRKREIRQKLSPRQITFANERCESRQSVLIDDFCRRCGKVTSHKLFATSIRENGTTKCNKCGNEDVA